MATLPWLRLQRPSLSQSQQQPSQQQKPSPLPPIPTTERPLVLRPIFRPISQPTRPASTSEPTQALPLPPQITLSPSSISVASPTTLQVPASSPTISGVPSPSPSPKTRPPVPRVATPPATPEILPALPPISVVASPPVSPQIQPPPSPLGGRSSPPTSVIPDLSHLVPTPPSPVARLPLLHSPITVTTPTPMLSLPPPPSPIVTTRVPASPVSRSPTKPATSSSTPLHHSPAANIKAPEVFSEPSPWDYPPRSLQTPDYPSTRAETLLRPPPLPSPKLPAPEPLSPVLYRNIPPEAEQKKVLYQKKNSVNNGKDQDSRHRKAASKGDDSVRMITLTGENRGAFMEVIGSKQRPQGAHKDNHIIDGRVNNEDEKKQARNMMDAWQPMRAIANSNVQGINNSIILSSSCNYHDPGVHLSLSRKPVLDFHPLLPRTKRDDKDKLG